MLEGRNPLRREVDRMKKLPIVLAVIAILLVGGKVPVLPALLLPPLDQPQLQPLLKYLLRPDLEVAEIWCTTPGSTLAFNVTSTSAIPLALRMAELAYPMDFPTM